MSSFAAVIVSNSVWYRRRLCSSGALSGCVYSAHFRYCLFTSSSEASGGRPSSRSRSFTSGSIFFCRSSIARCPADSQNFRALRSDSPQKASIAIPMPAATTMPRGPPAIPTSEQKPTNEIAVTSRRALNCRLSGEKYRVEITSVPARTIPACGRTTEIPQMTPVTQPAKALSQTTSFTPSRHSFSPLCTWQASRPVLLMAVETTAKAVVMPAAATAVLLTSCCATLVCCFSCCSAACGDAFMSAVETLSAFTNLSCDVSGLLALRPSLVVTMSARPYRAVWCRMAWALLLLAFAWKSEFVPSGFFTTRSNCLPKLFLTGRTEALWGKPCLAASMLKDAA
mmetsp:Transcript_80113/g.120399  ORF Transcript_80113/g.120399 Transcript_80113/m.120399 type:complete len:340 (-) Transcript_80113:268-1287(-)